MTSSQAQTKSYMNPHPRAITLKTRPNRPDRTVERIDIAPLQTAEVPESFAKKLNPAGKAILETLISPDGPEAERVRLHAKSDAAMAMAQADARAMAPTKPAQAEDLPELSTARPRSGTVGSRTFGASFSGKGAEVAE